MPGTQCNKGPGVENALGLWEIPSLCGNTECSTWFYNLSVLAFINFWREGLHPTHTDTCPSTLSLKLLCRVFFILCIFAIKLSGGNKDVKLCEGAFWWCSVYVQKWCLAAPFYYFYQNPLSLLIVFDGVYLPESKLSLQLLVSVCVDRLSSCIVLKSCQITFGLWMLEGRNVMPCNSQQTYTYKYLINQAPLI